MSIENFEKAFRDNVSGCRRLCHCGKEYYNSDGGWTWFTGELEDLEKNENSTDVDCSIGVLIFENKEYADVCNCWHDRAQKIVGFIESHRHQIARYINAETEDRQNEAAMEPTLGINY